MTQTAAPALRVLGCNDEQTICDACGKIELHKTVILCDGDGTEVGRYGTTCASRKLGVKVTANTANLIEIARRQAVTRDIRDAFKRLAKGDFRMAAMDARDARTRGVHLPDEIAALAGIDALTAARIPGRTTR